MSRYTEPNWGSSALVVIDLQYDFVEGGASPIAGTAAIIPRVATLAEAFRASGRPIAHIVRLYEPGGSDVDLPRREIIENGARIVAPSSDERLADLEHIGVWLLTTAQVLAELAR